jgi:phosphate starvation-inducible protein PhoH
VLQSVRGIGFIRFQPQDVVRHLLVQSIIQAYDRARSSKGGGRPRAEGRGADKPDPSE